VPAVPYLFHSSPKRNPNLLQRSEIVALINTLHRISESLQSVEVFRKLYAKTQDEGQAKAAAAIEEAKAEAANRPRRTKQPLRSLWYPIIEYYHSLRTTCQQSFWRCLHQIQRGPIGFLIRLFGFEQKPYVQGTKKAEL
jgi:hypothetical protein